METPFSRTELLFGAEAMARLRASRVAVFGIGGVGGHAAEALVRSGIGAIDLVDNDQVSVSNLNRQQYFPEQLGMLKSDALCDTLSRISPYCEIQKDCVKLTEENIPELLSGEAIICEAFDRADQKAMLVNCVLETMPEKYLVAGSGMAGIGPSNTIITRRMMKRFYLCGDGSSDVDDGMGLVASRVLICAAHQANAVIRIIAGEYDV